jgi:divalent metal cation (Fe/Co/Zn/Cd) transporter
MMTAKDKPHEAPVNPASESRAAYIRRGLRLEYLTIGYNLLEAAGSIIAGTIAGSIALLSFGLDSLIEVTSGAALVWRLASDHTPGNEVRERTALRVVGWCFIGLAVYIGSDSIKSLWLQEGPEKSIWGIVLAVASMIVMPLLARAKRQVAARLGSASLKADAKQTELCMYLSVILLGGLALNAVLGWWWADPVAALAMVPIMLKEGRQALKGKQCGCSSLCN